MVFPYAYRLPLHDLVHIAFPMWPTAEGTYVEVSENLDSVAA